jgi:hypothetical protein
VCYCGSTCLTSQYCVVNMKLSPAFPLPLQDGSPVSLAREAQDTHTPHPLVRPDLQHRREARQAVRSHASYRDRPQRPPGAPRPKPELWPPRAGCTIGTRNRSKGSGSTTIPTWLPLSQEPGGSTRSLSCASRAPPWATPTLSCPPCQPPRCEGESPRRRAQAGGFRPPHGQMPSKMLPPTRYVCMVPPWPPYLNSRACIWHMRRGGHGQKVGHYRLRSSKRSF